MFPQQPARPPVPTWMPGRALPTFWPPRRIPTKRLVTSHFARPHSTSPLAVTMRLPSRSSPRTSRRPEPLLVIRLLLPWLPIAEPFSRLPAWMISTRVRTAVQQRLLPSGFAPTLRPVLAKPLRNAWLHRMPHASEGQRITRPALVPHSATIRSPQWRAPVSSVRPLAPGSIPTCTTCTRSTSSRQSPAANSIPDRPIPITSSSSTRRLRKVCQAPMTWLARAVASRIVAKATRSRNRLPFIVTLQSIH